MYAFEHHQAAEALPGQIQHRGLDRARGLDAAGDGGQLLLRGAGLPCENAVVASVDGVTDSPTPQFDESAVKAALAMAVAVGKTDASGMLLEDPGSPKKRRKGSAAERFGKGLANPYDKKSLNAVGRSVEFMRIAALPRRLNWTDVSEALTLAFAKPALAPGTCPDNCPCRDPVTGVPTGRMKLRPIQAWAISEFYQQRGGLAVLGPGAGKTLISFLLSQLMGWQRPVLFVPAGLRKKTLIIDYPLLSRHWYLTPLSNASGGPGGVGSIEVCSYEELSRVGFADYLSKRRIPDGIIFDESHLIKRRTSGRAKRVFRYYSEYPETECVCMSGSIVRRSVLDYGHITLLALKDAAPLPHSYVELKTWADALDENVAEHVRPEPGALMDFCREGETVRDGYRRRFLEAPGIVSSPELSTDVGLQVRELPSPKPPMAVLEAFKLLRNKAELPGGELCTTKLDQVRHAKELFMGFYNKWLWPLGPDGKPKVDTEWLAARAAWRKFVRKTVARSHDGTWYDTEFQVKQGLDRGDLVCLEDEYRNWVYLREDRKKNWGGKENPPTKAEWISDYMIEELERWAEENTGIVWVENIGVLDKLRSRRNKKGDLHACFGAGENDIELEKGDRSVFASLAHTTGKNLQYAFHRMCFSTPLGAPEQGIGREHRPGQKEDDVFVDVYLGCRETWWTFDQSRRDAIYIEATTGQPQRMARATISATGEDEVLERCDRGDPLWALTGLARIDGSADDPKADAALRAERMTRSQKAAIRAESTPTLTAMRELVKTMKKEGVTVSVSLGK